MGSLASMVNSSSCKTTTCQDRSSVRGVPSAATGASTARIAAASARSSASASKKDSTPEMSVFASSSSSAKTVSTAARAACFRVSVAPTSSISRVARIVSGAAAPTDTLYLRCEREASATSAFSANRPASNSRPINWPVLRKRRFFFLRSLATAIPLNSCVFRTFRASHTRG